MKKVSLENWLKDRLIETHRPSADEIASLLHICDRDLEKVKIIELGPDWRLSIAHNAALQAATAPLAAAGYRAPGKKGNTTVLYNHWLSPSKQTPLLLSNWISSGRNAISATMKEPGS